MQALAIRPNFVRSVLLAFVLSLAFSNHAAAHWWGADADPERTLPSELKAMAIALRDDPLRAQRWAVQGYHGESAVYSHVLLAQAELRQAQLEAALAPLSAVEAQARQLEAPAPLLALLEMRAEIELSFVQFDACDRSIRELQTLAEQRGLALWHARALALRGAYWRRRGDYEQAMIAHRSALDLRERVGDQFGRVESLNAIAVLQRRAGELYQALDGHTKALRIANEVGFHAEASESQRLIARIYNELDDFEQAERFYTAALEDTSATDVEQRADILLELASVKIAFARLDEAEALTNEAIELVRRVQGQNYSGLGYLRRAQILMARQRPEEALHWIDETIRLGKSSDGARALLVKNMARMQTLQALEKHDQVVQVGEQVLLTAADVGDRLIERNALQIYAQSLNAIKRSADAFKAMARFSALNAEVASSMTSRRIADLEASLKRRELESSLALTEKQRDLSRLQGERQKLIIVAAAGVGLALIATVMWLLAHARRVRVANQQLKSQSEQLKRASETDALTGLPNRRGVTLAFGQLRVQPDSRLVVMLLDIDHFKRINDRYGHAGGDDVLRELGRRLLATTPVGMFAARWGGEEFLVCGQFPVANATQQAMALAQQLLEVIRAEPIAAAGTNLAVTTSIGVALSDLSEPMVSALSKLDILLQAADIALYEAKVAGRDQVHLAAH